jgi:alpha-L-fucosidase
LDLPVVQTTGFETVSDNSVKLTGKVLEIGDSESVQAGFQYRLNPAYGDDLYTEEWLESDFVTLKQPGKFSLKVTNIKRATYQYRTVVKHPLITIKGNIERFRVGHKEE